MATTATTATAAIPTATTAKTETSRTPEGFQHLARLVGRDGLRDFLADVQGKDAWRGRLPAGEPEALFGWKQLNAALAEHRLAPPRLRLELAGADASKGVFRERKTRRGRVLHDLDPAALNERLRAGATLILDAAHEASPPLQALCAGLSAELTASVQTNLYACWGSTHGFDVHWDDHDVFVVQVEGRKRWALYGSTREWPTYRDAHGDHRKPETPLQEIVLAPGDLLYLPRGYWHAAVGVGEPTLHLTIGITRKTGSDLLHWLADQALANASARADLPLERDDETLGAHVAAVIADALTGTNAAELGRRYRRHVAASTAQRPKLSFPFIGAEEEYAPGTRIRLAEGPGALRREGRAAVLSHRGADYMVVAELEPVLAELVAGREVAHEALSGAAGDASSAAAFVREMLARGVFVLAPGPVG